MMAKDRMTVTREKGVTIVSLQEEHISKLDEAANEEIAKTLLAVAAQVGSGLMLVSFAPVKTVNTTMLGTLIRLSKRVSEAGGTLRICDLPPMLHDMFVITRLDTIFQLYPDRAAALRSLPDS